MEAVLTPRLTSTLSFFSNSRNLLCSFADSVVCTLRDSSSAGLAAVGYDMGAVLQGFEALAACYPRVLEAAVSGGLAGDVAGLIKALKAVGKACSVFAVP
jgi:hypothetical protein